MTSPNMRSRFARGSIAAGVAGALMLGGISVGMASAAAPAQPTAISAVNQLPVKGRAPKTGYTRAAFGQAWADVDRNGCDTRNDVLRRDLIALSLKYGTRGCLVMRGTLRDPYVPKTIVFVRGGVTSNAVQIDHVVALADSWQKGAQAWALAKRTAFANDSLNLLAVDGPSNLRKGAGDAATWLPANKAFRCQYVARQIAVKRKYGLWVTAAERDAMKRVLAPCATLRLPVAKRFALGGGRVVGAPTPSPTALPAATQTPTPDPTTTTVPPAPAPTTTAPPAVYYANCAAARAAGAAPLHVGDPGYRSGLDGDGDGIACE